MHLLNPFDTLSYYHYAFVAGCLSLFAILKSVIKHQKPILFPLPPGPPSKPFIGHLFIMPREFQWKTFIEWGNQFGEACFYLFHE